MRKAVLLATLARAGVAGAARPAPAHAGHPPTQWQIDADAEALQHAPEPPVKPVICIVDFGVTPTPDLDIVDRQALDGGTLDGVTATPGNFGHGTTVAHMAAGKVNSWGASGVFPHARIASVRIFSRPGELVPWQAYVRALQECAEVQPTPVAAVLSLGGTAAAPYEAAELENKNGWVRGRYGMSVVAAAGNSGGVTDVPGRFDGAFTVTGIAHNDTLCAFSARGNGVDLAAPGCAVAQAGWDGTSWELDGTSFSAPIVAGALAAVRAYAPRLSAVAAEDVRTRSRSASPRHRTRGTAAPEPT